MLKNLRLLCPWKIFVVARVDLATLGRVTVALDPGQHAGLFLARVGVRDSGGCKSFTPALRFWSFSVPEETR